MVISLALVAILAFVVIRSLMGVVAREQAAAPAALAAGDSPIRGRAADDVRTLLSPAAGETAAEGTPAALLDITGADAYLA
jgi:hypothetical protein